MKNDVTKKERQRKYRLKNKEKFQKYYLENKEKFQKYYLENKGKNHTPHKVIENNYDIRGDVTAILFDDGREALINTCDLQKVKEFKHPWAITNSNPGKLNYVCGYYRKEKHRCIMLLHRYIMDVSKELEIDHINHDGLNNCRNNLRAVTHRQNMQNRNVHKNNKCGVFALF